MEEIREMIRKVWPEWKIVEEIGEGGFATVYKAVREDLAGTTTAAIKVTKIPRDRSEAEELRAEGLEENETYAYYRDVVRDFAAEIKLMDSVKGYTNIVGIDDYKVYQPEGEMVWYIFIRMELLTPLARYVALRGMDEEKIIRLGVDICTALEMCRQYKIVHRDIKPENIFVNDAGHFKLGDFGVARNLEKITSCLSRTGTPNYMAPEVYRSMLKETDFASAAKVDIYSLGVVLYWLANGSKLPFVPEDKQIASPDDRRNAFLRRMNGEKLTPPRNVSRPLQEIILKACAYDPDERYESAAKMRADLLALLDDGTRGGIAPVRLAGERIVGVPGKGTGEEQEGDKGGRRMKILAVILVLALAAVALWSVLRDLNRKEPAELPEVTPEVTAMVFTTLEPHYGRVILTEVPDGEAWSDWGTAETATPDPMIQVFTTAVPEVLPPYQTLSPTENPFYDADAAELTSVPEVEAGYPTPVPEAAGTEENENAGEDGAKEETEAAEEAAGADDGKEPFARLRERMIILTLYATGMRRAELCGLKVSDFDRDRKVIRVTGKGDKTREIPVPDRICQELLLYLKRREEEFAGGADGWFFVTDSGKQLYPQFVNNLVRKALEGEEGFSGKKSPHVLRHSLATHLLNNGADINSIKEVLGHANLAATQVYTHNSFEQLKSTYLTAHPRAKKRR